MLLLIELSQLNLLQHLISCHNQQPMIVFQKGTIMKNHWSRSLHRTMISLSELCIVLLLIGEPFTTWGATYYVAQIGSDSNPGTLNQPFKSFAQGISMLQPGDTLYIRGGVYTERIDTGTKVGSPGKYITIAAYPGESAILKPPSTPKCVYAIVPRRMHYIVLDGLIWDGSTGCGEPYGFRIVDGTHHFTVQNMEIKNGKYSGIYVGDANNITIRNNKIHDQLSVCGCTGERWYGIYFHHGTNSVIEGNEFYNNPGGGINIYPGPISNLVIRNNAVHHNNNLGSSQVEGILVFQGNSTSSINGVEIYNNLVYLNGVAQPDPGRSGGIRVSNGASGTKIMNNTVYGNKGWGINIQNGMGGLPLDTIVQNNIVFANTVGHIVNAGIDSILSHNLTIDPKFVNAETFDFRIQPHSPAIDTGIALDQVTTDIRNVPRPKGATHDIGAYEGAVSDFASPNPPMNLSVK